MPRVPEAEIEGRRRHLRRHLRRGGLGAAYICQPSSVHYYSGFTGEDSALLLTQRRAWLITDSRYAEEAGQSTYGTEPVLWKGSPAREVGRLIHRLGVRHAGFEEHVLPVAAHQQLRSATRRCSWRPCQQSMVAPRAVKSEWEVRAMRRALRVAEAAFGAVRKCLQPGMTEQDVAAELDHQMRLRGAGGSAFASIVATGANAALPHAHPGRRKLRNGQGVLIDWGARLGCYNSDLTRTLFLSSIPATWRRRYAAVLEAQLLAIGEIADGVSAAEVDATARQRLAGDGLAEQFSHSVGHGVGLDVHEAPTLSKRQQTPLRSGQVVTVEPGIYFPGKGGIRIEDMVWVGEARGRVLSRLPKDLEWVVV